MDCREGDFVLVRGILSGRIISVFPLVDCVQTTKYTMVQKWHIFLQYIWQFSYKFEISHFLKELYLTIIT